MLSLWGAPPYMAYGYQGFSAGPARGWPRAGRPGQSINDLVTGGQHAFGRTESFIGLLRALITLPASQTARTAMHIVAGAEPLQLTHQLRDAAIRETHHFHLHDGIGESRPHHGVADIVHVDKAVDVCVGVSFRPAGAQLLE